MDKMITAKELAQRWRWKNTRSIYNAVRARRIPKPRRINGRMLFNIKDIIAHEDQNHFQTGD